MGAKTVRPNRELPLALDVEGGSITEREVKAAREVAQDVMSERDFQRLANRITDEVRDGDSSLTRATRDRDRATPRDLSHVESPRLRGKLPAREDFRKVLSGRQRKLRSAVKTKVMASAPASQKAAVISMVTNEDPTEWRRINRGLHDAAGNSQLLADKDRAKVQRLDRAIQSYEQLNDRTHRVYVSVALPDTHRDIGRPTELPKSLQPGATIAFDQFTLARHNLHETVGHDSPRHVVCEIVTSRGMYLGRSDSMEDTAHILPRGMQFNVISADYVTYETKSGGFGERVIVQLSER